jgi:hypothetical protein
MGMVVDSRRSPQPVLGLFLMKKYGAFESHPCIYDETQGWVLFDSTSDDWRKLQLAEIMLNTRPMSEAEFKRTYGNLPALPKDAFAD